MESYNIHVSIVCPGPVFSEMFTRLVEERGKALAVKAMPTDRCTSLMLKGIYHNFDEMWIAEHPALLVAFINEHFPKIGRLIASKFIVKKRMELFYSTVKS